MTERTTDNPDILALLPRLEAADAGVRRIALIELADLEDPDGLPWLTDALLVDAADEVRSEAARLLEAWEEPEVVQALCAALADAAEPVRLAAAQSLSELKSLEAGQLILPWVNHAEAFVRASALRALRELRLEEAAAPALLALADDDAAVRRWAFLAGSSTSRHCRHWLSSPQPSQTQRCAAPPLAHSAWHATAGCCRRWWQR